MTKKEEEKLIQKARIIYYIDEMSVLLAVLIAVIFSDAIARRAAGKVVTTGDIKLDWIDLIISLILALTTYGTLYIQFVYNNNAKPPLIKRLTNALLQGIAWRSVVSWVD